MAMTLRLTDEQDRALTKLAEMQSISKQEAAVDAIQARVDQVTAAGDVKQWADHALVRYEALIDRLAQ